MLLFLDLDGVLCDFDGTVRKTFNVDYKERFGPEVEQKIAATPGFWENLPWLKDAQALWRYGDSQDCHILSAYADWDPDSARGKMVWIKRELGDIDPQRIHLVRRSEKQHFAYPNHILVDDYIRNVKEWEKSGGIGIHHKSVDDTIRKLLLIGQLI